MAARGGRDGHRPGPDAAYLALPPADQMADIRAEIASVLAGLGVAGLKHAHGRGAAQNEICCGAGGLVAAADRVQTLKYAIHQVAASYGKVATFMAKPVADEPGSGMSVHQALWRDGRPTFAGQGYADLSQLCLQFVAGLMAHARALNAFTNADHQQLQAPAPRPGRADADRLCRPQPLGGGAHPLRRAGPRTSGSRSASPTRAPTPISPSPRS